MICFYVMVMFVFLLFFQILEENIGYFVGDCLIVVVFLFYVGFFFFNYRDEFVEKMWFVQVLFSCIRCIIGFFEYELFWVFEGIMVDWVGYVLLYMIIVKEWG